MSNKDEGERGRPDRDPPGPPKFQIQIDRAHYTIAAPTMTGAQLRQLPPTPIGPDRDLWQVVPGGTDLKIVDNDIVELRNGLRFFTAPAQINPGSGA